MKKQKKLNLGKFKIARLATTLSIKGGVISTDVNCESLPQATIGNTSCLNSECNNQTHEFYTCTPTDTIETRTGDSLGVSGNHLI